MMNYSFSCPFPCKQEIHVDAHNQDDAINKMIVSGAMRCRNRDYQCSCDKRLCDMTPMHPEELINIIRLCMQEL